MEGEAAERLLRSINARAAYWPAEGGPETVILPRNPTRSMVVEELMHHGQYLNRGFPSTNPAINPTLGLEIEIEAQRRLMQHATRKAWTQAEIDAFGAALKEWQKLLSEAK